MIPGRYDPCNIILDIDVKGLRLFASTHVLRRFLHAQFLCIHKLRFSKFYLKRSFSPASLVFAHIRLHKPAAGLGHEHGLSAPVAFECSDKQSRAHLGRHAHKPLDSDQFRDVDAAQIPYLHLLRDVCDPQMCVCERLLDREIETPERFLRCNENPIRMRQKFLCQIGIEFLYIYEINIQTSTFRVFVRQSKDISDVVPTGQMCRFSCSVSDYVCAGI
jgi:hypothetical protein